MKKNCSLKDNELDSKIWARPLHSYSCSIAFIVSIVCIACLLFSFIVCRQLCAIWCHHFNGIHTQKWPLFCSSLPFFIHFTKEFVWFSLLLIFSSSFRRLRHFCARAFSITSNTKRLKWTLAHACYFWIFCSERNRFNWIDNNNKIVPNGKCAN